VKERQLEGPISKIENLDMLLLSRVLNRQGSRGLRSTQIRKVNAVRHSSVMFEGRSNPFYCARLMAGSALA